MTRPVSAFQRNTRRLLRDMHIPDWDAGFLADYDPQRLAAYCADADLNAVMLYTKSHVGLTNYPTDIGKMHAGLHGRDVLGELNDALRGRGIATSAYLSINFDSWAAETHPEWAQVALALGEPMHDYTRYGVCCPNNLDYRAYELGLLEEVLTRYEWDAVWLDMIFFLAICSCTNCRARLAEEDGIDVPDLLDWTDSRWTTFQAARRRWITEWATILIERVEELRPGMAVTHNLAPGLGGWARAQPIATGRLDTYTSMDLYGDKFEQLVVTKMAQHLSVTQPAELMVTVAKDLTDQVSFKSEHELALEALSATAAGSAYIVIDAIESDGSEVSGAFDTLKKTFDHITPYESWMGGTPVEDVAIYFSDDSFIDFADNGTAIPLTDQPLIGQQFPHVQAVRGAARALVENHIAFGVITVSDLDRLGDYKVVVLPNVSRTNATERDAFREYVRNGGKLYASGYTSLVDTDGSRYDDFALSDVFGVSIVGEETARVAYLEPTDEAVVAAISPQSRLSHPYDLVPGRDYDPKPLCTSPRLESNGARVLATLTLPYSDGPDWGSVTRKNWGAIHSSPPWANVGTPVLVAHSFGEGESVFSAFDLERSATPANRRLFVSLIEGLLGERRTIVAEARNCVWIGAFDQSEQSRILLTVLNHATDEPLARESAHVRFRDPKGRAFTSIEGGPGCTISSSDITDGAAAISLDIDGGLAFLTLSYA